ncbi:hypothetical protein ACQ4M3_19305 [Leptolyngbya sp. AN03gr2]|uniref:hypothetical protein n=1 Tax=Leptolyngbya sp. AN03gr2 TaxID=3423364 RepID=UPI003D31F9C3
MPQFIERKEDSKEERARRELAVYLQNNLPYQLRSGQNSFFFSVYAKGESVDVDIWNDYISVNLPLPNGRIKERIEIYKMFGFKSKAPEVLLNEVNYAIQSVVEAAQSLITDEQIERARNL